MKKLRNKFESRIHRQLTRAKASFKYESEKIPYYIASHYLPDFVIVTATGKIYLECKGYFRPEDKRKLVAVKRLNPQLDIRILFYARKEQYIKWATKNGFRYAVERIPKDWLEGL